MELYGIIFLKLLVAMLLGATVGLERTFAGKVAGLRTFGLVAMGSALFMIVSQSEALFAVGDANPTRVAAAIITGIGFLGAGLIIFREEEHRLSGLTTAAGLWVVCGIGIAVGMGMYGMAILATLITLITFTIMWFVEDRVKKLSKRNDSI